ncbi:plasmodesmata-located protein 6-like [Salvia splendens]|uniref:plasmodesmata-located protein 6-like n=1 Tax=Salvia splendens TaxID=180675 RepID=UPI001C25473F|nr:plasmodesmata-located protein 6-like [Salvia splendens]XP_041999598.1 plasmodesmata-located protein 6-like [Salvia splendens]XP_041999599.1 plasmodesmata-located protein 6-like [Salvia splendens]
MMRCGEHLWILCALFISLFPDLSTCSWESMIYVGCTQVKYNPGSPYESSLNSVLASLVNSASLSNYNTFKIPTDDNNDAVSGLYQCRGDLSSSDCHSCVANAISRIGGYCMGTCGGALQLDGCFIKYDNASFVGALDKTVVSRKCGPPSGAGNERDAVLAYLGGGGGGQYFRVGGSGRVQGVVQCEQDLSSGQCDECLSEAIQRLRTECATSPWGDVFLAKCYARYSVSQTQAAATGYARPSSESERDDNDETEKTLALFIGLIAGVTMLIVFISFLGKSLQRKDGM